MVAKCNTVSTPAQSILVNKIESSCRITSCSKVFLERRFAGLVMGHLPLFLRLPLQNFLIPSLCISNRTGGLETILLPVAEYRATKRLLAAKNTSWTTQPTLGLSLKYCYLHSGTLDLDAKEDRSSYVLPSPSPVETCNTVSTPAHPLLEAKTCFT